MWVDKKKDSVATESTDEIETNFNSDNVNSIMFKCEVVKFDFIAKTKKSLSSHITLQHFYKHKGKKYERNLCSKI